MRRICLAVQPDNLDNAHLQQLIHRRNLVKHLQNPLDGLWHGAVRQEHECVPLASRVGLCRQESLDELGCIGDEVLELLVYRVDGEYRVLADVRVSVFEAGTADGNERFKDFDVLGDLLEETKRRASYVFVWMLLA